MPSAVAQQAARRRSWCVPWCHVAAAFPSAFPRPGLRQVTGLRWCRSGSHRQKNCWEMAVSWCPRVSGQCHQGSRRAQETGPLEGRLSPPLDLICLRRSRFCVGEAVSCLKHKTAAHAGCSCLAGELESHKTLGAAALSLKGVKNVGERKNPFFWRDVLHLGLPPHHPEADMALVLKLYCSILGAADRPVLGAVPGCWRSAGERQTPPWAAASASAPLSASG